MSLFIPSNLSPNFEEVVPNNINSQKGNFNGVDIDFEFQVNTNGSLVRSYKLEILNDKNDTDVPEDSILATFYGMFDPPLYNKDIHTITLSKKAIEEQVTLEIPKDYRWRIRLYEDEIFPQNSTDINIQTVYGNTYVGAGHTVGTTKNVIWTTKINSDIVEDKYIQTILYSHDKTNDFNPFNEKIIKEKMSSLLLDGNEYQKGIRINTKNTYEHLGILNGIRSKTTTDGIRIITGIVVDINEILPEYRKKLTDGNMYLQLQYKYTNTAKKPYYDTNQLPQLITGINNIFSDGYEPIYVLEIDENQGYIYHEGAELNLVDSRYSLIYIQRQQIYSVDKSIGTHQLNKITLDEPLDYNIFHNNNIETKLMSDDFDRSRVYIDPIKEFDSKTKLIPSAYINIAYTTDQLIPTFYSEASRVLEIKPGDWDVDCERYFISPSLTTHVSKEYVLLKSQPLNWNDTYKRYYKKTNDGKYELIADSSAPTFSASTYYRYRAPDFTANKYYSYGISSSLLKNYTQSLACTTLTNYVSKTGECSLYSDLSFKPDRFYMYQIFILDEDAPNYDPSKSENPYKFFAGVPLQSKTGPFIDIYYLGGQKISSIEKDGITQFDFSCKTDILPIYSNHQIGDTNQYMCFVQPNLGIYEDQYKPCMLQLYNNKCQHDLYITNYNGSNQYNKDYSIDKLDDSQWLVVLTFPNGLKQYKALKIEPNNWATNCSMYYKQNNDGEYEVVQSIWNSDTGSLDAPTWEPDIYYQWYDYTNELSALTTKPQTKYKIYTNFVNSIPEAYFYYRDNKVLEFEYLDFYTQKKLQIKYLDNNTIKEETNSVSEDAVKVLPRRDVCVKCRIYDSNDSKKQKNLVTIKCYKYIIAEVNKYDLNVVDDIIYESDLIYDGKFEYIIKGLNSIYDNDDKIVDNPPLYRIQIIAEDEYGYQYNFAEDIYFGYKQDIVNDRISAQVDCSKQAVHVNFAPIKTFSGVGSVSADDKVEFVSINNKDGLLFQSLQDAANNTISISKNFIFYTKLRIQNNMFNQEAEQDILVVEDDSRCQYKVTFDTRVYIKDLETQKPIINKDYLSFKLYTSNNNDDKAVSTVTIEDIYGNEDKNGNPIFNKPSGFYYMIDTADKKTTGVYMIETSTDEQSVKELIIQDALKNGDQYYVLGDDGYYIHDNDSSDINNSNKDKMGFLYFKISSTSSSTSMQISQNNFK